MTVYAVGSGSTLCMGQVSSTAFQIAVKSWHGQAVGAKDITYSIRMQVHGFNGHATVLRLSGSSQNWRCQVLSPVTAGLWTKL